MSGIVRHIWILALAACALGQQAQTPASAQRSPGTVIASQAAASKPDQSYALHLPSRYNVNKKWPIVYAFDPDARGQVPVTLMEDAAERYGYIVVGSNNSRNGSWKAETDAAQAMWEDTHARFAIDDRRIYFAGFSGGARVAAALAQNCKCAAGVLLSGAGFPGVPPSHDVVFPVFAAVGVYDFNYPELSELDDKLEAAGFPHVLRHFDGPHQWAPTEVISDAFAWFELMAMKQNREPRDDGFIAADAASQIAQPPRGGSASGSQGNDVSRSDIFHDTQQKIVSLRERSASESNQDKMRVDRRALMGVFIAAGELGDESLTAKKFDLAKDYYQLASDAVPTSLGALQELAKAQALGNDRKGSLKTLRRAKEQSKDLTSFTTWLNDEQAFAKLRQDQQFRALLANP